MRRIRWKRSLASIGNRSLNVRCAQYGTCWPGRKPRPGLFTFMDDPIRIPITDVFDLHSVPPRDVKAVVEEYLIESQKLGFKALRIVHGRGIGVQREIVRAVLARTEFVENFSDAPAEAGGWGATTVTLK
jgi:hypothetical protein